MSRIDFNKWFLGKPDWKTISWEYNTGRNYQHKQDLAAIYWNNYIVYKQKFMTYYSEFNKIPYDVFNDLIFEFRQFFPKHGRVEGVNYFDDLIEQLIQKFEALATQQTETKTDKLKTELGKYGFFELPKVKQLSEPKKQSLIELISINPMPYGIAMFDYLGFCEYLDGEQGKKYKTDKILSRLYNENAKDGTSAKHYRRSLIRPMPRYKAGEYKETVKEDYETLK